MINLAVASLDRGLAETALIAPTRNTAVGLDYDGSALALLGAHCSNDELGQIAYATDGFSIMVVLVNYFEAPLSVKVEAQSDGSLFYGAQIGRSTYYSYDKQAGKYLPADRDGPFEIPAGNKAAGTVGVGAYIAVETSMFRGVGGLATVTSADRNLEGARVFIATQFAMGGDNPRTSVALTNKPNAYTDARDFYDQCCDDSRSLTARLELKPGQGAKSPDHGYVIEAFSNLAQGPIPYTPQQDVGTLLQHQVVVTFRDGGS